MDYKIEDEHQEQCEHPYLICLDCGAVVRNYDQIIETGVVEGTVTEFITVDFPNKNQKINQ